MESKEDHVQVHDFTESDDEPQAEFDNSLSSASSSKRRRSPSAIWDEIIVSEGVPSNTLNKGTCKHCNTMIDHHKHVTRV